MPAVTGLDPAVVALVSAPLPCREHGPGVSSDPGVDTLAGTWHVRGVGPEPEKVQAWAV